MQIRHLSTVLIVLTVVLAGCSSGGPADGTPTVNDTTEAPTTTAPPEFNLTDSAQQLRAAGSFRTTWTYSVTDTDGTTTSVNDTYLVDVDTNRSLEVFTTDGPDAESEVTTFVRNDTGYTRVVVGDRTYYQTNNQSTPVFDTATGRSDALHTFVAGDIEYTGTETFDGATVDRYEYSNASAWQSYRQNLSFALFSNESDVTVTNFTVVVLVDDDGIARQTTWTLSGETADGTPVSAEFTYSVTDVGSTTVEEPDWLDEAQS